MMNGMKTDIKVSVIVAVYNAEAYLPAMLNSICNQSLKEIEIICVDDGSIDNSLSILKEYAKQDERILVLEQKEITDGAAAARNLGLTYAQGQYVSILDADDFFELSMLEKVYRKAVDTCADIVIYDGYEFDEKIQADKEVGYILRREYLPENKEVFSPDINADNIFLMTLGAAWNCLFLREHVVKNQIQFQSFHHADDLGFVYTAFACAKRIAVLKERFIHYRKNNAASQAENISKWPNASYQALLELKKELVEKDLFDVFKVAFVQEVMIYVLFYLDTMKEFSAVEELYHALKEQYFKELCVYDIPGEKFSNHYWVVVRDFMKERRFAEFLFYRNKGLPPFGREEKWKKFSPGSKIIIYGAGNIGRDLFCNLLREKEYQIQAWVDQKYQKIGYPVENPDIINTLEFDYIVVAVAARGLYLEIFRYLLEYGIQEQQICWIGEE